MDRGLKVAEVDAGVAESGGERSEPEESAGARPDPEVEPKAKRRRFTAEYKQQILREAEACAKPGELGALLRREGLYSSHLAKWREQRSAGLTPRKRGRKAKDGATAKRLAQAEREVVRQVVADGARRVHLPSACVWVCGGGGEGRRVAEGMGEEERGWRRRRV